ncbi:hypothetical protein CCMSSC00406_0007911 [Pleurotus cornucopiae]|uniref:Uncharacterized protein n=1 Tax=Pleurotus cornucopiae TaxID=5321 RepID=A0ACB7IQZ5_PLECO|nr:hypothetical protein CCMSSC00406_0007911 [Pleurotus cornucopiae]
MASPPPPWATLKEPPTSSSPVPSNDDELEHVLPNATRVKRKARNTAATPSSSSAKPAKLPRLHLDATDAVNRSLGTTSMPQAQRRATHHFDSRDLPSTKPSLVEHVLMRKSNTSAATRIVRRKNRDKKPCLSPTPSSPPAAKRSNTIHAAGPSRHHASGSTSLPSAPPLRKQPSKPEVIVISDDDEPPSVSAPPKFAVSKGKAKASSVSSKGKTKSGPIDSIELTDSSSSLPSPSALLKAKPLQTYPIFKFAGKTKPQNRKARENCPTRVIKEEGREVLEILDTSEEESVVIPSSSSLAQPRAARTLPFPATHAAVPPSDNPRKSSSDAVDSYIDDLLTSIVAAQSVSITSHNSPPATRDTTKNATIDSSPPSRTFTPIEDHRTMPQPLPRRSLIGRSLAASPIIEAHITSDIAPNVPEDGVLPVFSSSSRIEDNLHKLTPSPPVGRPISTNGPLVTSDRGSTPPSDRSNSSSGLDGLRELVRRSRLEAKSRIQSHSLEAPSVALSSASEVENDLGISSLVYPDAELSTSDILDTREPSRDVVSGSEPPSPPASSDADSMPATSPVRVPEPEDESALESVPDITDAVEDESEFELEYWDEPRKAELPSASCVASGSEVTTLEAGLQKKPESIETSSTAGADIAPITAAKDKAPFRPSTGVQDVLALFEEYYEPASSVPEAASKTPDKDIVDELQALEMIHVHSPSRSPSPFVPSTDHRLVLTSSKTLGGNPVFTWQDVVSDLANFKQPCKLAKNIPHSLQDYINRMDAWHRSLPGMRTVLEAAIGENTAEDEPNAPPISIVNNFDDEPCPPWEFYYTNLMWHDEGVPPPDMTGLKGNSAPGAGNSRLILPTTPGGDSSTRTFPSSSVMICAAVTTIVETGLFSMVGRVFAGSKKIYDGTFLGIYSGELLTEEVAEERGKKYNKFGRTYLFDLDFYFLREGKGKEEGKQEEEWEPKYVVDAYHAGNFTRFLNHSCSPNARLNAVYINESNIDKPLLAIFACKDIEPGAEICFSYSGNYDEEDLEEQAERVVKGDAIYERCMCGAKNCTGIMFD